MSVLDRVLRLAPLVFPSWRLFTARGDRVVLWIYRGGAWSEALPKSPRVLTDLFVNTEGNLRLAEQSAVERLLHRLADGSTWTQGEIEKLVDYRRVAEIARFRARTDHPTWRITVNGDETLLAAGGPAP